MKALNSATILAKKPHRQKQMMNIDNIYNFKNTIRFFIQASNLKMPPNCASLTTNQLAWTTPILFRIRKDSTNYRPIKMPNILNFRVALYHLKTYKNFKTIQNVDKKHKRMSANLATGDFCFGRYQKQLAEDLTYLSIYDTLVRVDIKNFYGGLYTHDLSFKFGDEQYITNMNARATNGLIMGNYLSLYLAEMRLADISKALNKTLHANSLDVHFSYFSDDFYFFCNEYDKQRIINIFSHVLDSFRLERNEQKNECWVYETYNAEHIIDRYSNKIINQIEQKKEATAKGFQFLNQIIYYSAKINDFKLKGTFIMHFLKSACFQSLELEDCELYPDSYHQLCWIYKIAPEAILYSLQKFILTKKFDRVKLHNFMRTRFSESLKTSYHDEQLYYFYGMYLLDLREDICKLEQPIIASDNQILISYILKEKLFSNKSLSILKQKTDEEFWFQNYHLILYSDLYFNLNNSIEKYLVPKEAIDIKGKTQTSTYLQFYLMNLMLKKDIITPLDKVKDKIDDYLIRRYSEARI